MVAPKDTQSALYEIYAQLRRANEHRVATMDLLENINDSIQELADAVHEIVVELKELRGDKL